MSIQTINIGNMVNDGLGDDLRTAFDKVNNNFDVLTQELSVVAENIGSAGVGVFKQKTGNSLQLKKIAAGDATVVIVDDTATNTVKITSPLQNIFSSVVTPQGAITAASATSSLTFVNGDNIRITKSGSSITINADLLAGSLTGDLDLDQNNIVGTGNILIDGTITANNFVGNVHNIDIRPINTAVFDYDFGKIIQGSYSSITEFLFAFGDYDFGSITSPNPVDLDLGTI
jgi:hypothetical protein